MGIYKSTYIGVYITIKNTVEQVKESHRVNKQGRKFTNGEKFDPVTGEELLKITKIKPVVRSHAWVFNDTDVDGIDQDDFFAPAYTEGRNENKENGYVTLISNSSKDEFTLGELEEEETKSLLNLDFDRILLNFSIKYRKHLDYLKDQGLSYEVNYGVVSYAN